MDATSATLSSAADATFATLSSVVDAPLATASAAVDATSATASSTVDKRLATPQSNPQQSTRPCATFPRSGADHRAPTGRPNPLAVRSAVPPFRPPRTSRAARGVPLGSHLKHICMASAAAVLSSSRLATLMGRPVRSLHRVWKLRSISSRPWAISAW